jgi:hypothetical protein
MNLDASTKWSRFTSRCPRRQQQRRGWRVASGGAGRLSFNYQESAEPLRHEAPDLTFDGTLISDMSFEILRPENSVASRVTSASVDKGRIMIILR